MVEGAGWREGSAPQAHMVALQPQFLGPLLHGPSSPSHHHPEPSQGVGHFLKVFLRGSYLILRTWVANRVGPAQCSDLSGMSGSS